MTAKPFPLLQGAVLHAENIDGSFVPLAVDPATGQLIVQLATAPTIDIGKVELLGDDGAVIAGTTSDTSWNGVTANPTWTALLKGLFTGIILKAGSALIGKVGIDQTTGQNGVVEANAAAILAKLPTNAAPMQQMGGSVAPVPISAATRSDVVGAAADTVLLAANAGRKPGSTIVNDSVAILYILLAASGSSATNYWIAIDAKTTVPGVAVLPDGYAGAVCGMWASATGAARMTEMT